VECAREHRGRHPAPRIAHGKSDERTRTRIRISDEIGGGEHNIARCKSEAATLRHGVSRVYREIEDGGLKLCTMVVLNQRASSAGELLA
jgi:hypothetical protein